MTKLMRQANTQIAQDEKTLEFIRKAKIVHGDLYDYSKVVYINSAKKVEIACKEHGIFLKTPSAHLSQHQGCQKCIFKIRSDNRGYTTETFIKKSKEVHGDIFDYDKVVYVNSTKKVIITCKKHGDFLQNASSNLLGRTCLKCYKENASKHSPRKDTHDMFIKKAILRHNNKFDYSETIFISSKEKVKIRCKEHGIFTQKPYSHLKGKGCQKCSVVKGIQTHTYTQADFIKKARSTHGDLYDYSKVVYKHNMNKITIICKEHGEFSQTGCSHGAGAGCPKCQRTRGESKICQILIQNNIDFKEQSTFESCRNIRKLKFDFYLSKYNLCIEFDGQQHFKPIKFFGGIKSFLENVRNDTIKTYFCEDNNIDLLRISYKEFNKIEDILLEKLGLGI